MSGDATPIITTDEHDAQADLNGFRAADEQQTDYERRLRQERHQARTRADLAGPRCAAVYRRLVTQSPLLTDAEQRLLCILTYRWGSDLANCFPSRSTIAKALVGPKSSTVNRVEKLLRSCARKGFLKRIPLTCDEDGELVEAEGKRFISAKGIQFLLPASDAIGDRWAGPRVWSNRLYGQRRRSAE